MKERVISSCEKEFIPRAASEGRRLDGRSPLEYRKLKIVYGGDWGCCMVCLGDTKVLAQVSCEIIQPKSTRPNEGILFVNVELSPMGAPHFEPGRPSEQAVQCNRLLEKCLKESRCVDLESLCIVSDEKVWQIRVDLSVLNHGGSLVDAVSVAALAALAHFRYPDVTIDGEEVVVHRDPAERDFLPLSLHHHPVCISFALFNAGKDVLVDPVVLEERTAEAQIVIGINAYRELTALHLGGTGSPATNQLVMWCASVAAQRAVDVVRIIKETLAKDLEVRSQRKKVSFVQCINLDKITTLSESAMVMALRELNMGVKEEANNGGMEGNAEEEDSQESSSGMVVGAVCENSAEMVPEPKGQEREREGPWNRDEEDGIGTGGPNKWMEGPLKDDERMDSSSESEEDVQLVAQVPRSKKPPMAEIELSGGSEEDEVVMLEPKEMNLDASSAHKKESSQGSASKNGKNHKKKKRKHQGGDC